MPKRQAKYWHTSVPDAASQSGRIARKFPSFRPFKDSKGIGWIGTLSPHAGSEYKVMVRYCGTAAPKVYLMEPEVRADCPHVYPADNRLCMYWPGDFEYSKWTEDAWIADTIIPWTAVWLWYYELWLETGEWRGPEKSHTGEKK